MRWDVGDSGQTGRSAGLQRSLIVVLCDPPLLCSVHEAARQTVVRPGSDDPSTCSQTRLSQTPRRPFHTSSFCLRDPANPSTKPFPWGMQSLFFNPEVNTPAGEQ